jgi:hypothetical protein
MLLCIGSYLLCKMMGLQVISMGSFPIENEVTAEVLEMGEVLDPHGDGMEAGAEALMMILVTRLEGVAEVIKVVTAGPNQKEAAGMIG